jgi:N-acyl-D-amino-acid deacylase
MKRRVFVKRAAAAIGGAAFAGSAPAAARAAAQQHRAGRDWSGHAPARADLVLRNATVYDGNGAPPFTGDVAVTGGRIAAVGERLATAGAEELDLAGLALAPGFIDIHSHTDLVLLRDPRAESKVRQGVTTEVTGQDGSSVGWTADAFEDVRARYRRDGIDLDFRDVPGFLQWIDRHGAAVNLASMVGAGSIRAQVVGMTDRPATPPELDAMTRLVRAALDGGACGISSGLEYTPGAFAPTAELEALAATLRGTGLPFSSHMRNEDDRLIAALEEVIGVGQRAGVPVQVSHLKAQGQRNWWKHDVALRILEEANDAGIDARFDVYPYVAYATGLANLFPVWSREGGTDAFTGRLADANAAPRIEREVRDKVAMLGSWDAVQVTGVAAASLAWAVGRRLGELAAERSVEPYALLLDIMTTDRAATRMVGFGMSEENVARKLAHPLAMVCSDGGAVSRADGSPHPRNYGTFPRVLGRYCRELNVLPVEVAIRKMTSMPADRLRLNDRGRIAEGLAADFVAFDPQTVADRATFADPHQFPVGVPHVIVNGAFVIRDGAHTGARPGRAARPVTPLRPGS